MTTRGLWVDCAPSDVVKETWWRGFRAHGLTEAALMVERSTPGLDERYSLAQLRAAGELSRAHDTAIGLTFWPEPTRTYVDELERKLAPLLEAAGAVFVDLDAESHWIERRIDGFGSLEEAAGKLLRVVDAAASPIDVRLEVDTFPGHAENGPHATLSPHARRRYPQAYSVREREHKGAPIFVEWEAPLGPGAMQRSAIARSRTMPGDGIVCCGLAAYEQTWPGRRPEDAMRVAYEAAIAAGVSSVRWWSSRHVLGAANGYASRFLRELAEAEREKRAEDDTQRITPVR